MELTYVNDSTNGIIKSYINGTLISKSNSATGSYSNTSEMGYIGINKAQKLASNYISSYAEMNVYSARIYTKALTDAEVLHNFNYDKQKFNIG